LHPAHEKRAVVLKVLAAKKERKMLITSTEKFSIKFAE
jgi:hypothetical protein